MDRRRNTVVLCLITTVVYITLGQLEINQNRAQAFGYTTYPRGNLFNLQQVGRAKVLIPLYADFARNNSCITQMDREVNEAISSIFGTIRRGTRGEDQRLAGVIIGSAALAASSAALALGGAALAKAEENTRSIRENSVQIRQIRDDVSTIKKGLGVVTEALGEISLVVAQVEAFINGEILPALRELDCRTLQNTVRSKLNTYWIGIVNDLGELLQRPKTLSANRRLQNMVKSSREFLEGISIRLGVSVDELQSDNYVFMFIIDEIDENIISVAFTIYKRVRSGLIVHELIRVPYLEGGEARVTQLPAFISCSSGSDGECYEIGGGCFKGYGERMCLYNDRGSKVDPYCSEGCRTQSGTGTLPYVFTRDSGVLVNCDIITCSCDNSTGQGVVKFERDSCDNLTVGDLSVIPDDTIVLKVPPRQIEISSLISITDINITHNIDQLQEDLADIVNQIGSEVIPGAGNVIGFRGMFIWLIVLTLFNGGIISLIIWRYTHLNTEEEEDNNPYPKGEVEIETIA